MEATLQDTYSSVLVSNKSSTKSAAAVRTTELVDNDLYGSYNPNCINRSVLIFYTFYINIYLYYIYRR